jgi:glycerol-3-phosphate acyltransferase PlsX
VGLLNIGSEAFKGNEVTKQAHQLISQLDVNFAGYVEGDQVFDGEVDVIVCDGFVGNVVLKVAEGLGDLILELFRQRVQRSRRAKLGALLMRPIFRSIRQQLDYREYGGALLLGLNGVCVKSHGRSDSKAIGNALTVALKAVESQVIAHLADSCHLT